jgi:hypothetical protein
MLSAILDAYDTPPDAHASIMEITRRFNETTADTLGRAVSNKWVGSFVRSRLRLTTLKTSGVYVVPVSERPRVDVLAARFGVGSRAP